jgi:hypothetical protein
MIILKNKKSKQSGKGKTVMEQISDNGLFNKDYPDINNNFSKETQSALKILNSKSNSSNINSYFIKGGKSRKKFYKKKKLMINKTKKKYIIKKYNKK